MSQLSKLQKRVTAAAERLQEARTILSHIPPQELLEFSNLQTLEEMLLNADELVNEFVSDIFEESSKLSSKVDFKDPVTGEFRYGAQSQSKINQLAADSQSLHADSVHFQSHLKRCIEESRTRNHDTLAASLRNVESELQIDQAVIEAELMRLQQQQHELEAAQERMRQLEMQLHVQAEFVRLKKQQDAQTLADFKRQLRERLMKVLDLSLNSIEVSDASVQHHLQLLRSATDTSASSQPSAGMTQQQLSMALQTLRTVLDRVVNRPDDLAAKKLRITHPVLKERLTGWPHAIELLVAMGFRPLLTQAVEEEGASVSASGVKCATVEASMHNEAILSLMRRADDAQLVVAGVQLFEWLSPSSIFDVTLETVEPSVNMDNAAAANVGVITGKDSWIDWFDRLTRNRDLVDGLL